MPRFVTPVLETKIVLQVLQAGLDNLQPMRWSACMVVISGVDNSVVFCFDVCK